jgi:anhydro-N-acetylmuramic acid kinase
MKGKIRAYLPESFTIDTTMIKNEYYAIGIMSGTSLDGLDISLCRYFIEKGKWNFSCIDCRFIEYDSEIRNRLKSCYNTSARELVKIDVDFASYIGNQVNSFISKQNIKIDLVASHGQTIFHSPVDGYSKQIGSGAVIASVTNLPVVSDFRQQDVTLGGQGAPLVPVGDKLLFGQYDACLNLGGFANISYDFDDTRIAFDICAVNIVLNMLAGKLGFNYDSDGELAAKGKLIPNLLKELGNMEYYSKSFPKSLGQEWIDTEIAPILDRYSAETVQNQISTYTMHICNQIAKVLNDAPGNTVIITGGGAKNKFIVHTLQESTKKNIVIPGNTVIDFKEAIIFGFLGVLRFRNETNCIAPVTGASRNSCTGALYIP